MEAARAVRHHGQGDRRPSPCELFIQYKPIRNIVVEFYM